MLIGACLGITKDIITALDARSLNLNKVPVGALTIPDIATNFTFTVSILISTFLRLTKVEFSLHILQDLVSVIFRVLNPQHTICL